MMDKIPTLKQLNAWKKMKGHPQYNTGRTHFKKGKKGYWTGKKRSSEDIEKIRKANIGKRGYWTGKKRPNMQGKNNPRWNGGATSEEEKIRLSLEYKIWKLEVYKRDKGICRICKIRCNNKSIVAHHIKLFSDFPELRFSVENGLTLCRSCHVKLHNPRIHNYD